MIAARPYGRHTRGPRPGRLLVAVLGSALMLAGAAPGSGQETCAESAGTLGIQGLRCGGCTYSMSENGIDEARFRTEPQVLAVARGFTSGDRLHAGDRIVAIDGALITTREGGDRLVGLRVGKQVAVRVRRDGRVVDLEIVPGSACELRRRAREAEVEVERMEAMPPGYDMMDLPPEPPGDTPQPAMPPRPTMPAPPSLPEPPAVPPSGYLGFGLRCTQCGIRDGAMHFAEPPEITGVAEGGAAARAGLQSGDVILEVDGLDITGRGAERFRRIEPGQSVRLTVRRDDETSTVALAATERPDMAVMARPAPRPATSDRLRFQGRLGDTRIEVRGAPVTVTRDRETGELVIRAAGTVIRLTAGAGDGG